MKKTLSVLIAGAALSANAAASDIWVTLDHARIYKSNEKIKSVIGGNPAVADFTLKSSHELILFGVAPGSTNIILLSADGEIIDTLNVSVRNPSSNRLTLQVGGTRYTYACTDVCEQVPAIGDGNKETLVAQSTLVGQAQQRLMAAQGAANSSMGMPAQPTDPFTGENNQKAEEKEESSQPGS